MSEFQIQGAETAQSIVESSHDTFHDFKNWLVNSAGVGIFANGRIHQQSGNQIYVGDLIHKRGHKKTDDILLMEEQATFSHGEALSVPSRAGKLLAMEIMATMSTANGEGELIAYYENAVVSFNTAESPRETRSDGKGEVIQRGWDSKKLVSHLLNTVSAVGRYAVAAMPRDHFFRSVFGLHLLRITVGDGSLKTEQINRVSQKVDPLLDEDDRNLLRGVATGYWVEGNRVFATTGLISDERFAATACGRGFVSWNQATTFTEDLTPIAAWEGLWTVDNGIAGIHWFGDPGIAPLDRNFGFLCSDTDGRILFASITSGSKRDYRDGKALPIEWSFETGAVTGAESLAGWSTVTDGRIAGVFSGAKSRVRVLIRTDIQPEWKKWHEFSPCGEKEISGLQEFHVSEPLGKPPEAYRTGTWFQVRVEGIGAAEVHVIDLDMSSESSKSGRSKCAVVGRSGKDFFEINSSPASKRWASLSD